MNLGGPTAHELRPQLDDVQWLGDEAGTDAGNASWNRHIGDRYRLLYKTGDKKPYPKTNYFMHRL